MHHSKTQLNSFLFCLSLSFCLQQEFVNTKASEQRRCKNFFFFPGHYMVTVLRGFQVEESGSTIIPYAPVFSICNVFLIPPRKHLHLLFSIRCFLDGCGSRSHWQNGLVWSHCKMVLRVCAFFSICTGDIISCLAILFCCDLSALVQFCHLSSLPYLQHANSFSCKLHMCSVPNVFLSVFFLYDVTVNYKPCHFS